ncbi:hypothetical protein D8Y22_12180 [Salinadaptatus halalkaliphilus]|uniref:Uncharacterized protein n=1 Tax=Salinadaptatus halalkaliphilus TaxID=2419781 RepID=A0A4S3TPR3_9EURY|nr:hypothetical protein [Salinadaptatus halalkaliphilus]THE64578.1 hypothetical protein D8Y22_12180 [Salinadaptatus halalkaliphilus]
MSRVRTIARADLERCFRSRTVVVATVVFVAVATVTWLPWLFSPHAQADDRPLLLALRQVTLWTSLFALVLGAVSLTDTADSSQFRTDTSPSGAGILEAVLGTLLGRLIFLAGVCTILVAVLAALIGVYLESVAPASIVGGLLALVLFGGAWLGLTVGLSAWLETVTRTVGVAIGCLVVLGFLWHQTAVALVSVLLTGGSTPPVEGPTLLASLEEPTWYLYATRVSPFDAVEGAIYYLPRTLEVAVGGSTTAPHLPNLFGLAVLGLWTIGPVLVGQRLAKR